MGKSGNLLFKECSTPKFVENAMLGLGDDERENQDAVMACLITHVNTYAHEQTDIDGRFNNITFTDVANVAKSLYVGIKHGYSVPPYKG